MWLKKKAKEVWAYQFTPAFIFIIFCFSFLAYNLYKDTEKEKLNPKPKTEHRVEHQDDRPTDCEYDAYHGWSCN